MGAQISKGSGKWGGFTFRLPHRVKTGRLGQEDGAARAASDCTTTKRRGAVLAPVPPGSLLLVRPEGNFSEVYRLSCLTPFACRSGQTSSMLGGAQFKATPLGSKALASHTPGEQRRR